jgi:inner membrane protein
MILGHLPAGYVLAKLTHKQFEQSSVSWPAFLVAALLGAVAPDFDMAYYLIDNSRHHHAFVTHFPLFWGGLLLASALWFWCAHDRLWATLALIFAMNGLLHLALDSMAGSIRWAVPVNFLPYSLTTVPQVTGSRRLDYLMHWSSWLELMPMMWAFLLWMRAKAMAR